MQTRHLGNSDLEITPIGIGAWAMGGRDWAFSWGRQEDKESIAAIHAALDAGVNWIDTAAVYGLGHSELAQLQKEGKVRYIGVSNFNVAQMKRVERIGP